MPRINKTIVKLKETLKLNEIDTLDVKRFNRKSGIKFYNLFCKVEDPRVVGRSRFMLAEVLLMAFFAILSGANTWVEIAMFGHSNLKWLKKFSKYKNGTPSHDEICYIFSKLMHSEFQTVIIDFLRDNIRHIRKCLGITKSETDTYEQWAIDGKEERGTGSQYNVKLNDKVRNIQTLHVWNVSDDICIFSKAIDEKTNEIPVAQSFLRQQDSLTNTIITFDALHTQKETVRIIIEKGGQYVAGVKGNQPELEEDVELYFTEENLLEIKKSGKNYIVKTEKAHSMIEKREFFLVHPEPDTLRDNKWEGIVSYVCCKKTLTSINKPSVKTIETRFYISSIDDITICSDAIRGHWACEIGHWQLDHTFREDENSTMNVNAYENLSLLFKMVLALFKLLQVTPNYKGCSIRTIQKMFGWNLSDNSRILFSVLDKNAMQAALAGVKLTDNDKKKIRKTLKELNRDPL